MEEPFRTSHHTMKIKQRRFATLARRIFPFARLPCLEMATSRNWFSKRVNSGSQQGTSDDFQCCWVEVEDVSNLFGYSRHLNLHRRIVPHRMSRTDMRYSHGYHVCCTPPRSSLTSSRTVLFAETFTRSNYSLGFQIVTKAMAYSENIHLKINLRYVQVRRTFLP